MATARSNFEVHHSAAIAGSLLDELREAHQRLFAEMANMDAITLARAPNWVEFCAARWRISEASLTRRSLSARIVDYLLGRAGPEDAFELKGHKAADQELLRTSAAHVSAWPLKAIEDDWRGYCKASRQVRAHMTAFLLSEQRILFPMLRQSRLGGATTRAIPLEKARLNR